MNPKTMRFRRRAKLFPGVYLNFSKSGISTTIGVPGASINIGTKGTYLNTGIPGTGLYNRERIGSGSGKQTHEPKPIQDEQPINFQIPDDAKEIKSQKVETTTSDGLGNLKKTLVDCYRERQELSDEIKSEKRKLPWANFMLGLSYVFIIGFFVKWFKRNRNEAKEYLLDLEAQLKNCYVNLDLKIDHELQERYHHLRNSFEKLSLCHKIWDMTSIASVDRFSTRSAASVSITREQVKFGFRKLDVVRSKFDAMYLQNANGGDMYFYPAFIAIVEGKNFGLVDIRDIDFHFVQQRFVEEEQVPSDAKIVDRTWAKVNKNGTQDKRFKDNYEIPVCQYGKLEMKSNTGLHEAYAFSNYQAFEDFANKLDDYKTSMK